jgi:hypothetical protein
MLNVMATLEIIGDDVECSFVLLTYFIVIRNRLELDLLGDDAMCVHA